MRNPIKLICISAIFLLLGTLVFQFSLARNRHQKKIIHLIWEIDHQSVLKACREFSRNVEVEGLTVNGRYWWSVSKKMDQCQLPQAIADLDPTSVYLVEHGSVMVEMMGGLHHYGLYAYPENISPAQIDYESADRELIPGLWYYDDGYVEDPDYADRIEKLKPGT